MRPTFLTLLLFLIILRLQAQTIASLDATKPLSSIGKATQYFKDADFLSINTLLQPNIQAQFKPYPENIPNFGAISEAVWFRFNLAKATEGDFHLQISSAFMDSLALYTVTNGQVKEVQVSGDNYSFSKRAVQVTTFLFELNIRTGDTQTYFLRVKTMQPFLFLLRTGTLKTFMEDTHILDFKQGIYLGFMMLMVLYNLFLFFSTRDRLYLLYVTYVMSISWFMSSVYQYIFEYIWPHFPIFNEYAVASSGLTMLTATLFTRRFLNTQQQVPRLHTISTGFLSLGILVLLLVFTPFQIPALLLAQGSIMLMAIFFLITGITIFYKGYQPAKFYLVAWSSLILGFIAGILGDLNVLPVMPHINPMQIGSALEVALLSFALADRINLYKKQRENAQNLLLAQTQENERILANQNEILEKQVGERTSELNQSLQDLKLAQIQLIQAEKMASLGELTAGIAHEINNPINFVASSLQPLKRNLESLKSLIDQYDEYAAQPSSDKLQEIIDYKEEIDYDYTKDEIEMLLSSISDGANRTTEIVKGLRNFSRLDEADRKKASLNEGIESTLLILQSSLKQKNIRLIKLLGEMPEIQCYAGQLNQVFMNILNNAIHAMPQQGTLTIQTFLDPKDQLLKIEISDTGCGIPEANLNKIFDPFFTTKQVGEGTGLGLSISYGIVKKHNGTIEVESEVGKGSTFRIQLPIM
jgi:signal transduction histidine kinase